MRKISRVVVREMTTLTNEEMALITGGNVGDVSSTEGVLCTAATKGQKCDYYDESTGYYAKGTCKHYYYKDDIETISYSYCG